MQDANQRAMCVDAGLPKARGGSADGCGHAFALLGRWGDVRGKAPPHIKCEATTLTTTEKLGTLQKVALEFLSLPVKQLKRAFGGFLALLTSKMLHGLLIG